jgi:hypothetical protein
MAAPLSGHHVAVLLGGLSSEREVSLVSGAACAEALERLGSKVTRVDAGRDLAQVLTKLKPDVGFNALHGEWGEDGCVQGILETLQVPYTHCGVLASALAMDKAKAKAVMAAATVRDWRTLWTVRIQMGMGSGRSRARSRRRMNSSERGAGAGAAAIWRACARRAQAGQPAFCHSRCRWPP